MLNKIDLDEKDDFMKISEEYTKIGYKVIQTDAKLGIGIDELIMKTLHINLIFTAFYHLLRCFYYANIHLIFFRYSKLQLV